MVFSLTWLPEVLERAGLKVAEVPEWRTRGRGEMGRVRGVMVHHTVGSPRGNMPSLDLLVRGRPDLSGPLAQLGLGRDGTFYIIAAGRANHAGEGNWRGVTAGNSSFIGIEAENTGRPDDIWPDVQMDALRRGVAAMLAYIATDSSMVCGHKEFALPKGRKPDPLWEMAPFRESVARIMAGGVQPAPQIPARDAMSRPTLRRGAQGELVKTLQLRLGVEALGIFGPKTEAAVREFQRTQNHVPDGIVGPRTWALIEARNQPGAGGQIAAPAAPPPSPRPSALPVAATDMPPVDDPQNPVRVSGLNVLTPDGRKFATLWKKGVMTIGTTSVRAALAADPGLGVGIVPERLGIIAAISGNEGQLEAINSWDAAFMSLGIMQWTAGQAGGEGELAALLALLLKDDPAAFAECFGRFGIGVSISAGATTGFLTLDGRQLASAASKSILRRPEWAYRFWRAGNHPAVQKAQIAHATARFARVVSITLKGHSLPAWFSSQLGMGLILDQHVNRPGHVAQTAQSAVTAMLSTEGAPADPGAWTEAHEHRLIERYLSQRARTNMTHGPDRAKRMFDAAVRGTISSTRGSFK